MKKTACRLLYICIFKYTSEILNIIGVYTKSSITYSTLMMIIATRMVGKNANFSFILCLFILRRLKINPNFKVSSM